MIDGRRSWFEAPRWWLRWAVTALALFALTWVVTAALGGDPREDLALRAVLDAGVGAGTLLGARHDHRRWRELAEEVPGGGEELVAAERVVRRGAVPAGEGERELAVRIAVLRWREVGGSWVPGLLAVLSVAAVVLAVVSSPWWLALGVAGGLVAAVAWVRSSRIARRRTDLELVAV